MSGKNNQNLTEIHVTQLKPGMFVAELDCGWLATPFAVQGLLIRSQADVDRLFDYARTVWIDPLRQVNLTANSLRTIASSAAPSTTPSASRSAQSKLTRRPKARAQAVPGAASKAPRHSYPKQTAAVVEQPYSYQLLKSGRAKVSELLSAASEGRELDIQAAEQLVTSCMTSVLRNPDASLWMSRLRHQDEYTLEHCFNVAVLAMVFGRFLGYGEKDLVTLGLCGLLHDLGKMRVPRDLLNKPGKLTPEEYEVIKRHSQQGYQLLQESAHNLSPKVLQATLSHHERIDGRGYPRQIAAEKLPAMVRIITIVDAYDAMTADRCYSRGISHTQALKIIYEERGHQFDDALSLEFIRCMGVYPPGSLVELMNGAIGLVQEVNEDLRHLPQVLVLKDPQGQDVVPYLIDLRQIEQGALAREHLIRRTLKNGSHGVDLETFTQTLMQD